MATYQIKGRILSTKNNEGLSGLVIEAHLKKSDGTTISLNSHATTSSDGIFTLTIESDDNIIKKNDLFFKVYSEKNGYLINSKKYKIIKKLLIKDVDVEISYASDDILYSGDKFRVRGLVLNYDGTVPEIPDNDNGGDKRPIVNVYSVSINGNETALSTAVEIDEDGSYVINFTNEERKSIRVKVLKNDGSKVLLSSPVIINPNNDETINLSLGEEPFKGLTEFEKVVEAIDDKLNSFDPDNFKDSNFAILTNETGLSGTQIDSYIHAKAFAHKLSLNDDYVEVFYGLIAGGLPKSLRSLLLTKREDLENTLEKAINDNIIFINDSSSAIDNLLNMFTYYVQLDEDSVFNKNIGLLTSEQNGIARVLTQVDAEYLIEKFRELKNNISTDEELWTELISDSQLSDEKINAIKCVFELSAFAKGNTILVEKLYVDNVNGYSNLSVLTVKNADDWLQYINENNIEYPGFETPEEYANYLADNIEKRFPSKFLLHRMKNDNGLLHLIPQELEVEFGTLFSKNPDLKFETGRIKEQPLVGNEDGSYSEDLIIHLEKIQRLYGLVPRNGKAENIAHLLDKRIDSAASITKKGQNRFFKDFESVFNEETLHYIYSRAFKTNVQTLMSYAKYGKSFNEISTYAFKTFDFSVHPTMRGGAEDGTNPQLEDLLGGLDYCTCRHCRSVQSAAAYLVDLLLFVNEYEQNTNKPLYTALNTKRPDLKNIKLNCKNTSTLIPYIDLVNEVLEEKVHDSGQTYQTTHTADEIKAYPEYINVEAYQTLRTSLYPWNLPFDLWAEESRGYLGFTGITRREIMEKFPYTLSEGDAQQHTETDIATEELGLSQIEKQIICNEGNYSWENHKTDYYNCSSLDELKAEGNDFLVIKIMDRAKLSFEEFNELLKSRFVNNANKTIIFENYDICDLNTARISFMESDLDKLHRFCRLKEKLEWSVKELDIAIMDNGSNINDDLIIFVAGIKRLQRMFGLPPLELFVWFNDRSIDYNSENQYSEPSLFTQLFLNKAVINSPVDIIAANGSIDTANNISIIKSALNLTAEEIIRLKELYSLNVVNLESISLLTRIASFCKANSITVDHFIKLKNLSQSTDIFDDFNSVRAFVDRINYMRQSPFTVEDLDYLINANRNQRSAIIPSVEELTDTVNELKSELIKKESELIVDTESKESVIRQFIKENKIVNLGNTSKEEGLKEDSSGSGPSIIPDPGPNSEPDEEKLSHYQMCLNILTKDSGYSEDEKTFIISYPAYFKDTENALKRLTETNNSDIFLTGDERLKYFISLHNDVDEKVNYVRQSEDVLENVIIDAIIRIVEGAESISEEEQQNIVSDQPFIFGDNTGNVQEALNKLVIKDNSNYLEKRQDRFDYIIKKLSITPADSKLDELKHILKLTMDDIDIGKVCDLATGTLRPVSKGLMMNEEIFIIDNILSEYMDAEDAKNKLVEGNVIENPLLRIDYIIEKLRLYHLKNIIINFIAVRLSMPADITEKLLTQIMQNDGNAIIFPYLERTFLDIDVTSNKEYFSQTKLYERIYKTSLFVKKYNISVNDALLISETLKNENQDAHWMDIYYNDHIENTFTKWTNLNNAFILQKDIFKGDISLFDFLAGDKITAELAGETQWPMNDLDSLLIANGFSSEDKKNEIWLMKLRDEFEILNRIGISAGEVLVWNRVPVAGDDDVQLMIDTAQEIRQAIKSHYDNKSWIEIAVPMRNELRKMQRDALVGYMFIKDENGTINYNDIVEIYNDILMDPEMSPCSMTSRIKQATLSIQLFIQRVLLNLEGDLSLSELQKEQWKWRKNYRVWEANRRVFITPENWLEPELRTDKSPMFEKIEDKLTRSDITAENVHNFYLEYLEQLNEVSNLEVAGMFEETFPGSEYHILHVIGRTRSNPRKYYYRKQINSLYWEPWQPVDVEIDAEQIVPVVWNGQLFIYWPVFIEKMKPQKDPTKNHPPKRYFDIKLAWTSLKDGKWRHKKVSSSSFNMYKPEIKGDYWYKAVHRFNHLQSEISLFSVFSDKLSIKMAYPFDSDNGERVGFCTVQIFVPDGEPVFLGNLGSFLNPITNWKIVYNNSGNSYYQRNSNNVNYIDDFVTMKGNSFIFSMENDDKVFSFPNIIENDTITSFNNIRLLTLTNQQRARVIIPTHNPVHWNWKMYPWMYLKETDTGFHHPSHPFFIDFPENNDTFFVFMKRTDHLNSNITPAYSPGFTLNEIEQTMSEAIAPASINISSEFISQQAVFGNVPGRFYGQDDSSLVLNRNLPAVAKQVIPVIGNNNGTDNAEPDNGNPAYNYGDGGGIHYSGGRTIAFDLFKHPFVGKFIQKIQIYGLDYFLKLRKSDDPLVPGSNLENEFYQDFFESDYAPEPFVHFELPVKKIDYSAYGSYGIYNWELFFHLPVMVANRLSQNQRFEEAMKWYHYIFDPTVQGAAGPADFWRFEPFRDAYDAADNPPSDIINLFRNSNMDALIEMWQNDPFNPHAIASFRTLSYMSYMVMKYLDNLIAYGDMLFRRDTLESLNEATNLYLLAAEILGRKPEKIDSREVASVTFQEKRGEWDMFGNTLVDVEANVNVINIQTGVSGMLNSFNPNIHEIEQALMMMQSTITMQTVIEDNKSASESVGQKLYFCIPVNDKLLGYWDTVADRLFKLRNCMNIKGIVRQLPLFEPPIDPGLLIKAKAAGIDLTSALNDINIQLPVYRFRYNLQKAVELTAEVKSLGNALLSALEKSDAEDMALLRAKHLLETSKAMTGLKKSAIEEAETSVEALELSVKTIEKRKEYYESREMINRAEKHYLVATGLAANYQIGSQLANILAGGLASIPDSSVGVAGLGPLVSLEVFGGKKLNLGLSSVAQALSVLATIENTHANVAATLGGYQRRWDDWEFQAAQASLEIPQMEKQIVAAKIRKAMAEKELENLGLQIEQAETELEFLKNKFTNKELYNWLVAQLSNLYFQSYQMAYDMAKRAEKAFVFELGIEKSDFIRFGNWDNLKKGLLAGEKLHKDLQRLDIAYMEENKREYELTKHVSLAMLNPQALIDLRETGSCVFEVPEVLYDIDYPGHYFRRIKGVSISIPAVTGPYTNVSCRLTMETNRYRKNTNGADDYIYKGMNDQRFVHNITGLQSIATSSAQNDSGMFRFDFNDERYLPFEGAGAIGRWSIDMPDRYRQFDYDTIADVIIHINYTAREGGDTLKNGAVNTIDNYLNFIEEKGIRLQQMFSMKAVFPDELRQFLQVSLNGTTELNRTTLVLNEKHFPFFLKGKGVNIKSVSLYARSTEQIEGQFVVGTATPSSWAKFQGDTATDLNTATCEINGYNLGDDLILKSFNQENVNLTDVKDDIWVLIEYSLD